MFMRTFELPQVQILDYQCQKLAGNALITYFQYKYRSHSVIILLLIYGKAHCVSL